ncbi:RT0821/Lpp0805 family surface protein [Arenibaculum pallidiluteum]|uniref:RT0821/Lpp0805 family surface protein n=1 Tax=Arenibaculum pallidiluteum TaxID=2812559 RepID=UPI001A973B6C|nr:RT0821/Lpp0805 family surface protein [Arenibaculum pallidiluteum]
MFNLRPAFLPVLALAAVVSACAGPPSLIERSAPAAPVPGPGAATAPTVSGALAGHEAARRLSDGDGDRAARAERRAAAENARVEWSNPATGRRGLVEPVRTYENSSGQLCREYTHTLYADGRAETLKGTACREPSGGWRLVT